MGIDTSQTKSNATMNFGTNPNSGGANPNAIDKQGYMTGVYGYQEGVSSFGIMENGTAFFGRADRGGRIIIDGFNA